MPKKRKIRNSNRKKKTPFNWKLFGLLVLLVTSFLFLKLVLKTRFWTGKDTLNILVKERNGNVVATIFNPISYEITSVIIPADTQVEVARGLGVWKVKSIWDLGKNEGLGGELLARTVSKSLKFPVYVWADAAATGFNSSAPFSIIRAVVLPYKTNLSFGDKVAIGLFSLKVKNVDRSRIDLSETTFLQAKTLQDGTDGFVVSGLPSPKLYANFLDQDFTKSTLRVIVKDGTGDFSSAKRVGEIIEILGAKVSSVTKEEQTEGVCEVGSSDTVLQQKIALIFGCKEQLGKPEDNFDLEIKLGKDFTRYF